MHVLNKVIKFFSSDERLYQEYTVTVDEENIGEEEICTKKANKQIHIIPVIEGAKAAGKIVIGLALIAASFIPGLNVIAAKVLLAVGTSLVIGGITDLLSKPPKIGEATQTQSFLMGGNVNTAAQGQAVPIGYGRLRVGSQVISVSKRHRVKRSQGYEEALAASNERGWKEYVDNLIYSSSSEFEEIQQDKASQGEARLAQGTDAYNLALHDFRGNNVPDNAKEYWQSIEVTNSDGSWKGYDMPSIYNNPPEGISF